MIRTPTSARNQSVDSLEAAIADVLADGKVRTPDIGGTASTTELGSVIASRVSALSQASTRTS